MYGVLFLMHRGERFTKYSNGRLDFVPGIDCVFENGNKRGDFNTLKKTGVSRKITGFMDE